MGGKSMRRSWNPEEIENRIRELQREDEKETKKETEKKRGKSVDDVFG